LLLGRSAGGELGLTAEDLGEEIRKGVPRPFVGALLVAFPLEIGEAVRRAGIDLNLV
jgi:hypothetical protein